MASRRPGKVQINIVLSTTLKQRLEAVLTHQGELSHILRQHIEQVVAEREEAARRQEQELAKAS
jgi:NAD(P)H-hydrate repair Nnr-like enzyme with NAD(P)H-hydrate dehydratase domain